MGLGLMGGVTLTHHLQVRQMVEQNGRVQSRESVVVAEVTVPTTSANDATKVKLAASDVSAQPPTTAYYPPRTDREDALLELLSEMRKEQKRMHKQMAEQNREIAELTFRVDTHSDSFKPLRTDSSRPHSLDTSVVPQVPISDDDQLLPPAPLRRGQP